MPTASAARRRKPDTVPPNVSIIDAQPEEESLSFFDRLQLLTDADRELALLYLYRLEPKVNKGDRDHYIALYPVPDPSDRLNSFQELVRRNHGGGKYQVYLKWPKDCDTPAEKHIFSIEGKPRFGIDEKPDAAAGSPQPANGATVSSDQSMAGVVREIVAAVQNKPPDEAFKIGMETMRSAQTASIDIMKAGLLGQVNSETGNKLGDELVRALIQKVTKDEAKPDRLSDAVELIKTIRSLEPREPRKETNPEPAADPLASLATLKDLFDLDIKELLKGGGKNATAPWYAQPVVTLIGNLPSILDKAMQMQQAAFVRAVQSIQIQTEQQRIRAAMPQPAAAPVQPARATQSQATAAAAASPMSVMVDPAQQIQALTGKIAECYEKGYDGVVTAILAKEMFPELVQVLAQVLTDEQAIGSFVTQDPILGAIAKDGEWPEFEKEFLAEMNGRTVEDQDKPDQSPEVPTAALA